MIHMKRSRVKKPMLPMLRHYIHNFIIMIGSLTLASILSYYFHVVVMERSMNISLFYMLAIILINTYTGSYVCGIFSCVISVVLINYLFTFPYFKMDFLAEHTYPLTFLVLLISSIIISSINNHLRESIKTISERDAQLAEAEKEKMRANLLRAVSHDLRTPLTSIIGASSTYLDNRDTLSEADKCKLVSQVKEDSMWLLNMVENLLSVTKINGMGVELKKSLEPVEEVVSEAITRVRKRNPGAKVEVTIPEEFIMIPMDPMLIEQVIINLTENAIRHSHSLEPVQCKVDHTDDQVAFHIIDFGIGIPEERLNTIFDGSGYMPHDAADNTRGMGIGLSICKSIILAHEGTIEARNHKKGAEFTFTLPRGEEEEDTVFPEEELQ